LWAFGVFALAGLACYANTFTASFHLDDLLQVAGNKALRDAFDFPALWALGRTRFLSWFSFAVVYQYFGNSLLAHHAINLAVHVAASFTVFRIAMTLLQILNRKNSGAPSVPEYETALFCGLVFLCHPLQTQAVTYILERRACLAALFFLLAVYFFLRLRISGRARYLPPCLLFAAAGMLSKENAYCLPAVLALCEAAFFARGRRRFLRNLLILIVLSGALFFVSYWFLYRQEILRVGLGPWTHAGRDTPRLAYFATQGKVVCAYLRLLFLPLGQNIDYDFPFSRGLGEPAALVAFIFLAGLAALAVKMFSKERLLSFGIFWILITLGIESSVIVLRDVMAEHRLYLPMAGFTLVLAVLLRKCLKAPQLLRAAGLLLVTVLGFLTFARNAVWASDLTLWGDAVKKSPRKARPYLELGNAYSNRSANAQALPLYRRAVELDPRCAQAYSGLALVYHRQGSLEDAVRSYEKAIELDPGKADFYFGLGMVLQEKGDIKNAALAYQKAVKRSDDFPQAHNNLGVIDNANGHPESAMGHFRRAIVIRPDFADAYFNMGLNFAQQGQIRMAVHYCLQALEHDKRKESYYSQLGVLYGKSAEYENALKYLHLGLGLFPDSADIHRNLAITYFKAGDLESAKTHIRELARLGQGDAASALERAMASEAPAGDAARGGAS
jgi:Tfp pilus assembly protein PilF